MKGSPYLTMALVRFSKALKAGRLRLEYKLDIHGDIKHQIGSQAGRSKVHSSWCQEAENLLGSILLRIMTSQLDRFRIHPPHDRDGVYERVDFEMYCQAKNDPS